jgi:osmotically-inducible protein OsmY
MTGKVGWHFQSDAAEQAIRPLAGVTGISNQVLIAPPVSTSNIVDNIMHALHRSWFFDPHTVKVSAQDGDVRLTGVVTSWHDRQVAGDTAWAAPGVTNVENDLSVV